ncbi:hypothetical protein [Pedobacter frigoris]|uniref:hypothetical protein n=1 Tax=Pedobacter frigoris TaxID=2571272 RepID=UPI00292E5F50|nr:hypothetical protein [Pedobacter frigoris]
MKINLSLSIITLLLCTLFIGSCKKNENDAPDQVTKELPNENIIFNWGQAHNGRWLPYLLGKIKQEHPQANAEEIFLLLGSYLQPINDATAYYSENISVETLRTLEDQQQWLRSYYSKNYDQINNSLALRKDMDILYEKYKQISTRKLNLNNKTAFGKIQSIQNSNKRMTGDNLEEVVIRGGCYIPHGLKVWIDTYYGPQYLDYIRNGLDPMYTPVSPTTQKSNKGEVCENYYNAFSNAVFDLVRAFGGCDETAQTALNAILNYTSCIPQGGGSSPSDPYGPGNGNGGSTGTEAANIWAGYDLKIDSEARPCLSSIASNVSISGTIVSAYESIFSDITDHNTVAGMIVRLSNSNDWNVKIREEVIADETDAETGAITRVNARTRAVGGVVSVTFNKNYLNQATDLAVARTMIHELMHAYFVYGISKPTDPAYAEFVEANDLLFKKDGTPFDNQNNAQHQLIAAKYVDKLGVMLEYYAISRGITSPNPTLSLKEYCKDLAWGGLSETKAYRKYAPNKSRIQVTLLKEQNNAAGSTNKKGC